MKTLHILKSKPDRTVERLIQLYSDEDGVAVMVLYQSDVNWSRVVDEIFAHDKVICWW